MMPWVDQRMYVRPVKNTRKHTKAAGGNVVAHSSTYRIYLRKSGENRLAKMMDSPYHPYSDTRFTINEKGADDMEEAQFYLALIFVQLNGNRSENQATDNSADLQGVSRDTIAADNGIVTGTVSNFKDRPDISSCS